MKKVFEKVINIIRGEEKAEKKVNVKKSSQESVIEKTPAQKKQEELAEMEVRQNELYAKLTQAPREHQEKLLSVIHQLHGVFDQGKGKNGTTKSGSEGRSI